MSLGAPFQVSDATLKAAVDSNGLRVTDLDGTLFGGNLGGGEQARPGGGEQDAQGHALHKLANRYDFYQMLFQIERSRHPRRSFGKQAHTFII